MKRRALLKQLSLCSTMAAIGLPVSTWGKAARSSPEADGADDRRHWYQLLYKISLPVLGNAAAGTLHKNMPVEAVANNTAERARFSHLEALGRTLAGIAPWLQLNDIAGEERKKQAQLFQYAVEGIAKGVDPASPGYLNFREGKQPLVDGAFLSHALLRAPRLWRSLSANTRQQLVTELKAQRQIEPYNSNWLLFAAINEALLLQVGEEHKNEPIEKALKAHNEWYKGDGWYGDGPHFHFDYYNSFVIQPMTVDVLKVLVQNGKADAKEYETALKRLQRHGQQLEMLISPEGTYPPIGRSIAYRVGAFQALADLALKEALPPVVKPAQVRCALTAVMQRQFGAKGTFDQKGWLQLGFCGHQPEAADSYISTGSLYLCTTGFLPLGLPAKSSFWSDEPADWTAKKAWSGKPFKVDKAVSF